MKYLPVGSGMALIKRQSAGQYKLIHQEKEYRLYRNDFSKIWYIYLNGEYVNSADTKREVLEFFYEQLERETNEN